MCIPFAAVQPCVMSLWNGDLPVDLPATSLGKVLTPWHLDFKTTIGFGPVISILAEGAIALPVTLSGGVLFAS